MLKIIFIWIYLTFLYGCSSSFKITENDKNDHDLLKIQKFAEEFNPKESFPPVAIPFVTDSLRISIMKCFYKQPKIVSNYLTLILLKTYKSHLRCCNQSYELRTNMVLDSIQSPILFYFLKYTEMFDVNASHEFIPSSIGYSWVIINPAEKEYYPIKKEMKLIEKQISKQFSGFH